MKSGIFFLLIIHIGGISFAQNPPSGVLKRNTEIVQQPTAGSPFLHPIFRQQAETCNNYQDDDGNMLADCNDFHCYFSDTSCNCRRSDIVWFGGAGQLFWYDLQTGIKHLACNMAWVMSDITWTPNGKLYGLDAIYPTIYEINPYTGDTTFVRNLPAPYYYGNGMTSDYAGNLYLTVITPSPQVWHVIKLDIATGNYSVIANLTNAGLASSGDLTFLNGYMYVSCDNFKLARINLATGAIQSSTLIGVGSANLFGLVSTGSSDLYVGANNELYRIDTLTLQATTVCSFLAENWNIQGMCNYQEACQSPSCRPSLRIDVISSAPYCSASGVKLKATGVGINGSSISEWTLPDGNFSVGDTLIAYLSGTYKVRYHTIPDSCGKEDSINISVIQSPVCDIGNDTLLCPGGEIVLQSESSAGISSYLWQDGSVSNHFNVSSPGLYWVQVSGVCGISRDSVMVTPAQQPMVNLGADTILCPGESFVLKNRGLKNSYDHYHWSDGSSGDSIMISGAGVYWLASSNLCGAGYDTIRINMKDSCVCNPLYPVANLGADKEICPGNSLVIHNLIQQNGVQYLWQNSFTGEAFTVRQPGVYWVSVRNHCGTANDTIIVREKVTDCVCQLFVPTSFTPNSDGRNDMVKALSNCVLNGELFIYNRWGELVYYSMDLQKGWNGMYKGRPQPQGVYVYQINYQYQSMAGWNVKKGFIALLR